MTENEAIGTIEEFKELKEKNMAEEVKENNKQLVCEIKIDTEMLKKVVNEKVAQIKLDIQAIRNKAIDEFAEKLNAKCDAMIKNKWNNDVAPISWANAYADFKDDIDEIAEQMKGGAV